MFDLVPLSHYFAGDSLCDVAGESVAIACGFVLVRFYPLMCLSVLASALVFVLFGLLVVHHHHHPNIQ